LRPFESRLIEPHYAVVLNPQSEIDAGADLRVAVCTTSFGSPLPSGWFPMPTRPGGHTTTGLTDACVVKATWLDIVPQSSVIKVVDRATATVYKQVKNWVAEKERQAKRGAKGDSH
jgi:hypothetical protein